ncbi:MAG: MotA/TolQ/ExbB proton channel family protein [Verrucomicrobia bacterium]|nr:MotA/TolQ/ExbB proton channel family protein [Verrucomicrobiota bacterium]
MKHILQLVSLRFMTSRAIDSLASRFVRRIGPTLALLLVLAVLAGASTVRAVDFSAVAGGASADLETALAELAALRKQIETERLPLAQQGRKLEQQVLDQRRELERAQRFQENQLVELNALKTDVKRRTDEHKFLEALLGEYLRGFETRVHISEVPRFQEVLEAAKTAGVAADFTEAQRLERQAALLTASLDRIERVTGGELFAGKALSPAGRLESGKFALLGPVSLFASDQSEAVGVAELQLGSAEATVLAVPATFATDIRGLTATGTGDLPLDASLGNALKIGATKDGLFKHILKGGPVMVPILLLGMVAVVIFVARWFAIGRVRTASPGDLQVILGALRTSDRTKATAHASGITGPVGEMLHAAIDHCRERKEYIEEVMYEKMLGTRPRLEKWLPFLALSAAAAPLLGLLGTVTGMINTFNMITVFGAGDPKTLAGGISEALITTEFGLVVAIPSLLLHAVLSRRVKGVLASMEQTAVAFINGLPSQSEETLFLRKENQS